MHDPTTTLALVILTLMSLGACATAIVRLKQAKPSEKLISRQHMLVGLCAAGCCGLFIYRWIRVQQSWQPLGSHLDGLLLLAALFGMAIWYLTARSRMPGLSAFAMPFMALMLTWAFCASSFTFRPWEITSIVKSVHLVGVYGGTIFFAVASISGGMYLYVQKQLRNHRNPTRPGRLASLESLESLIIRTATLGFVILTIGLITGLVIVTSGPSALGPGWWYSPKIILATSVWLIYAVVMNVRHTTNFRGARAAWLSIAGLVLLLATFGIVSAMSGKGSNVSDDSQSGGLWPWREEWDYEGRRLTRAELEWILLETQPKVRISDGVAELEEEAP